MNVELVTPVMLKNRKTKMPLGVELSNQKERMEVLESGMTYLG